MTNEPAPPIARAIERAVSRVAHDQVDDRNGVFRVRMDDGGLNLVVARKWVRGWKVEAYVGKRWSAPANGGVTVEKTW